MNCNQFGEKEQMTDLLMGEKYLASSYNSYLLESATPEVKQCLCALMNDTHSTQQKLFEEMNSRGYYPVTKAQEQKIGETKMKFSSMAGQV